MTLPYLHRVTITGDSAEDPPATKSATGRRIPKPPATLAEDAPCTLHPGETRIVPGEAGERLVRSWSGFFPAGSALPQPGHFLAVTAGPAPLPAGPIRVVGMPPWGDDWEIEIEGEEVLAR